jgi:lipopolysaccharide export system protein LptA
MLRESASIEQDGAVVTGESIQYFMAEQRVRADATADDETSRVQVFIPADVVEAAQSDRDSEAGDSAGDAPDADTSEPTQATPADGEQPPTGKKPDGDPPRS